jgi:hypothetical protein
MQPVTHIFSRLKELTASLAPRHDAFRYLYTVRTESRGRRTARLTGSGWRGLVPQTSLLRRRLAALLKALD